LSFGTRLQGSCEGEKASSTSLTFGGRNHKKKNASNEEVCQQRKEARTTLRERSGQPRQVNERMRNNFLFQKESEAGEKKDNCLEGIGGIAWRRNSIRTPTFPKSSIDTKRESLCEEGKNTKTRQAGAEGEAIHKSRLKTFKAL